MARPTFLIAEPEADQALSSRKLVVETAKFNVITAHSRAELLEMAELFPNVDALILHTRLGDDGDPNWRDRAKNMLPGKPLILLSPSRADAGGDHLVDSHDPQELVNLLRRLFGDPRPDPPSPILQE